MALEVLKLRGRGFIALNAHPVGCLEAVRGQFAVPSSLDGPPVPGTALVRGAPPPYGPASAPRPPPAPPSPSRIRTRRPTTGARAATLT